MAQRRHDDAQATEARQEQRDRRLAGWTAAISDALTDTQLTAAVDRVTRPVDGLDRRSVPVAASQLLALAITTATSAPDKPLHDALTDALTTTAPIAPTTLRRCQPRSHGRQRPPTQQPS